MAKILFAQNTLFEVLSFCYISATVKKYNHEVDVIVFLHSGDIVKKIEQFKPDVVGFSCITGDQNYVSHIAGKIKKHFPEVKILVGGPHPTYFPEFINTPNIDIICIGEGEYPTLDLMNALDRKKKLTDIPNLWVKTKDDRIFKNEIRPLNDLNNLPFMDRELYCNYPELYQNPTKMFFIGRGCKENCTFCFTQKQKELYKGKGKYLRQIDMELLIAEIQKVKECFPRMKTVRMMDDSFTVYRKRLLEFLAEFEKSDLELLASVCLNEIDEEVAAALERSRCKLVYVGIESGNEELRNKILKKRLSTETLFKSVSILKAHHIQILSGNIFGFPEDTIETALETIKVNIDLKIDYPTFAMFTPYPGTKLTEMAIHKHLIDEKTYRNQINLFYDKLFITHPDIKKFYNIYHLAPMVVRIPLLFPFMKYLIRARRNFLYKFSGYFFIYLDSLKREGINFHRLIKHPLNRFFSVVAAKHHQENHR